MAQLKDLIVNGPSRLIGDTYSTTFHGALDGNAATASQLEYIEGTQTAATNVWTGQTQETSLVVGKMIAYRLPYAGTSTAATLTLTFADGTTSTAIPVLAGTVALKQQYGAGSILIMTYDGNNWRTNPYYDTNTDTNTKISIYRQTVVADWNNDYPLIISRTLATSITATNAKATDVYGVIYNNNTTPTVNPTTGAMKVPGGIDTSQITVTTTPTADMQVATKKYVDDAIGAAIGGSY